ncbi:MAG: lysine--tRNA ligase [Thermoplasmata archaeon]|nr:lysine--tRNA ligase [Thermoplasmata archaeon]
MHWVDVYAEKLLELGSNHIIESGTGISGQPHLGSAGDIIYADGIHKKIIEMGGSSRAIWAMDDMDGLRKVPAQLPKEFEQYIGQPAFKLPCPDGCCDSFVEHFTSPFLEELARADVKPEAVSVAQMYIDGKYDEVVRIALEKASEIRVIFEDISGSVREEDWLPFFPICQNCGKILSTKAYEFDGRKVKYRCRGGIAGKADIPGCGHEGEVGIREGKLPWRVEWAARWSHLGVTCEPMGKDLTAAGGTYETSSIICEQLFGSKAPMPVPYEFIVMSGKKLGKSIGRVLTFGDMAKIVTPEISKYFFFRSQPTAHKNIDFEFAIPKLAEDYENAERVFFGDTSNVPEKEIEDIKRSYELSQISGMPDAPGQASYSHLLSIIQTNLDLEGNVDWDGVLKTLARTDNITQLDERTMAKGNAVKTWLDTTAPEDVKFAIQKEMPADIELNDDERKFITELAGAISKVNWEAGLIHDAIYETSQACELKAGQCFKALYKIFLGKNRGPRLGFLLASLDRDFVVGRIEEATKI